MSESSSESLVAAYRALTPASRVPTKEQQLRYLQLRIEGLNHVQAARAVKSTGTRFRMLSNRPKSEMKAALAELEDEIREARRDRIRTTIDERAFDKNDPASARFLQLLGESELPELSHKRTKTHIHAGTMDVRLIPWIDQEKLAQLPDDDFATLMGILDKIRSDKSPLQVEPGKTLRLIEGGSDS